VWFICKLVVLWFPLNEPCVLWSEKMLAKKLP
jgi:hypothetical protein